MVTGAYSYTGKYIAKKLLDRGECVRTITGHPDREHPFGDQVDAYLYNFDKPEELVKSLRGVSTLYNNYWIRFTYGDMTFEKAVENTKVLIEAALQAEVNRLVHISITNADETSSLPYFRGKGIVERIIRESGISYAILRPTVIFGKEDVLINNIAWFLRTFPIFGILGNGRYRIQPVYVDNLAEIAVEAAHKDENIVIDAVGPETFSFNELVHLIKEKIQSRAKLLHLPPWLPLVVSRVIGRFVNDVVLTKEEVEGLMGDLLYSQSSPRGKTRLSTWLEENKDSVGTRYASELKRHYMPGQKH
jgi:NADH dehydrogenase